MFSTRARPDLIRNDCDVGPEAASAIFRGHSHSGPRFPFHRPASFPPPSPQNPNRLPAAATPDKIKSLPAPLVNRAANVKRFVETRLGGVWPRNGDDGAFPATDAAAAVWALLGRRRYPSWND